MIEATRLSFKDNNIKECFDTIGYEEKCSSRFQRNEKFRAEFSNISKDALTWDFLCEIVNKHKRYKYGTLFLIELIRSNMLVASSEILESLRNNLSYVIREGANNRPIALFCGNQILDAIFHVEASDTTRRRIRYDFMPCNNKYFRRLLHDFLESEQHSSRWGSVSTISLFAKSLGEMLDGISSYTDFNERTFWQQIDFYKNEFAKGSSELNDSVCTVCYYYRWLVKTYSEHNFFVDSFHINRRLLFSPRLPEIIEKDYYVTAFDPKNPPVGKSNVCFIIRNMKHLSTKITDDDFFTVTLEPLQSQFYKDILMRFLLSDPSMTINNSSGHFGYVRDGLCVIEKAKAESDYPNPDLAFLNTKEAMFIRKFYHDEKLQLSTMNNRLGAIRRFFNWCKVNKLLIFEDMFFDYLKQYEEPPKTTGDAVSDPNLAKLHDCIVAHADNDYLWKLMFYLFHLLLVTNFRINQLLHLDINCIETSSSMKKGEYRLRSNTKVSHDVRPHTFVITEATYRLLMEAINFTEDVRSHCTDPNLRDYIFLYEGRLNSIRLMDINTVRKLLRNACVEAGAPHCSPTNLRDTYMTKSFEYIQRHGKSDIEMGLLSKHKSIDTTKSHYIQLNLEKMLEATYGVELADIDDIGADDKVVDSIPGNLQSTEHDVQDGCGKCKSEECFAKGPVPCLICKDFLTTVEYEKFFISAIEKIDRAISCAPCRHDVEDLVITKTLYVKFLEAIYKRKEMNNDN